MDNEDIIKSFHTLLADTSPARRREAEERLKSSGDPKCEAAARAASIIFKATTGQVPLGDLAKALPEFDLLPPSSFWNSFSFFAGKRLLLAAKSVMELEEKEIEEMQFHGLQMLAMAQNRGFPLPHETIAEVELLRKAPERVSILARSIIKANSLLLPEAGSVRPPGKPPHGLPLEKKPAAKNSR